ncbi:hypothetical protein D3C74_212560 [compost metagenome]
MSSHQGYKLTVLVALSFFLLIFAPTIVRAADPPRLYLNETDWRTGEIMIDYSGAIIGYTIKVHGATFETDGSYKLLDSFTAVTANGRHVTSYLENGQSVWFYITLHDQAGNQISKSNVLKQTPPITAFIINWPDMLKDLDKMLNDAVEKAMTPSQDAQDKLKNALDGLKNAVGGGAANNAGNQLQNAINAGQGGMKDPAVKDDGNGTFTGGNTGGKLPSDNKTGDSGLNYPDPDSGTSTEMTIRIPYMADMQGNLVYVKLFTKEQMEKMKWWDLARNLAGATIWVMFGIWLVQRFTPQLKV